jgi:hypothetical protein
MMQLYGKNWTNTLIVITDLHDIKYIVWNIQELITIQRNIQISTSYSHRFVRTSAYRHSCQYLINFWKRFVLKSPYTWNIGVKIKANRANKNPLRKPNTAKYWTRDQIAYAYYKNATLSISHFVQKHFYCCS